MGENAMSEELDKVLNKADRIQRVYELLRSYGADERQAHVGSTALAENFTWTGSVLNFNATGKIAADDPACKEFIVKDYAFLLPSKENTEAARLGIDADVLASARAGNKTAYAKVYVQLGKDRAATDALLGEKKPAAESSDDDATKKKIGTADHRNNPFSREGWNISAQGKLLRAVGVEKCAAIARSVGSKIGATQPSPHY
jgi:hypothetical protein